MSSYEVYYQKIGHVEKKVFHEPIDINVADFLGKGFYNDAKNLKDEYVDGGRFISCISCGKVVAGYFHPTKKHSVTACPGYNFFCTYSSETAEAPAGTWAVIITGASMTGRRTFYNIYN